MIVLLTLLLMAALLLLKGFFSGSEIALVSADRVRLRHRAAEGNAGAKLALRLLGDPPRLLTTTLLGGNIASIALGTIGTLLMVGLLAGRGELAALILFTPLFLIFGEIVPKSVHQQRADTLTPLVAYPLAWLQTVLASLVWLFSHIAKLATRLISGRTDEGDGVRDQFLATVQMAERTNTIEAFSRGQVRRVLRYAQMTAAEAMWPLSDVRCLERTTAMSALVELRRETGQRLIPLFDGTPTNLSAIAIIESWDILDRDICAQPVERFMVPVKYAPQLQRVSEIIKLLQTETNLTVIVVDELGNAVGLITLNLLVRRTLGAQTNPLTDRRAADTEQILWTQPDGSYLLDARLPIVKVNEALDVSLSTLTQNTIGGFALAQFGRLPDVGESFSAEGYTFTVAEANERAILQMTASPDARA